MKKNRSSFYFISCLLLAGAVMPAKAAELTDSIPPKKTEEAIKEVPKSRKQEKPVAVLQPAIKPVAVKPKIVVRPIIKVH